VIRLLASQLPDWARPDHPILRYELAHLKHPTSLRVRFLQVLMVALLLGLIGYLYATYVYVSPTKGNWSDLAWRTLYFPTLLVQAVTAIVALSYGVGSIGQERSRHTWDHLRATEVGAEMILRTRWIAILYRLRLPILAILMVRMLLVVGMLYDITAFGGRYTEMLTQNIIPVLPEPRLSLVMVALIMTANILVPLTMMASAAALGILISVAIQNRAYSATVQVILGFIILLVTIGLLLVISQVLQGQLELDDAVLFGVFLAYSAFGDWGLLLAQMGSAGEVWRLVPYGVFIGGILVILMLIQSAISDGMIWLAVKLSESQE